MATVFTNTGKNIVTNLLAGVAQTALQYIAWGVGTTTAAANQNALTTESSPSRAVATTRSVSTTTVNNDTYLVVGTLTAGGSLAVTEAGLFDASTGGNMGVRGDFAALNVAAGDSIQFTFKIQFT